MTDSGLLTASISASNTSLITYPPAATSSVISTKSANCALVKTGINKNNSYGEADTILTRKSIIVRAIISKLRGRSNLI